MQYEGNGSKKWDGREIEMPRKTAVQLGQWTAEGLEEAWPGKGGKSKGEIWKCVLLPPVLEEAEPEENVPTTPVVGGTSSGKGAAATTPTRGSRGKWWLERELREIERQSAAWELTQAVEIGSVGGSAATTDTASQSSSSSVTLKASSSGGKHGKSRRYVHMYICTYIRMYVKQCVLCVCKNTIVQTHLHTHMYTYICIVHPEVSERPSNAQTRLDVSAAYTQNA